MKRSYNRHHGKKKKNDHMTTTCKHMFKKKMDKLEEMNKFLENCNLQGINQEDHWFDGSLNEPSKSLMKQKI